MFGYYEFDSQHTVGGSSSQPNLFGSSSQPNLFGSSSQPNVGAVPRRRSGRDASPDPKEEAGPKMLTGLEEEAAERKRRGPTRERRRVLGCGHEVRARELSDRQAPDAYTSGAGDTDYLQTTLTDYQVAYRVSFTLLHCWEVLKECGTWNSGELLERVGDEEDEVHEVRRSRPMGKDQAKKKAKAGSSSTGSANAFDVESLAKMMAN
ncbi:hypothetical protein Tco_1415335, partial [Tanacetum coccineum]